MAEVDISHQLHIRDASDVPSWQLAGVWEPRYVQAWGHQMQVQTSSIPNAGLGLFARSAVRPGAILLFCGSNRLQQPVVDGGGAAVKAFSDDYAWNGLDDWLWLPSCLPPFIHDAPSNLSFMLNHPRKFADATSLSLTGLTELTCLR